MEILNRLQLFEKILDGFWLLKCTHILAFGKTSVVEIENFRNSTFCPNILKQDTPSHYTVSALVLLLFYANVLTDTMTKTYYLIE
jgi:hypothetical protein